ncbi:MAG: hypothetical protein FJW35_08820 [Acidobacteria bacterium]|nr:hypothetical protein [Acidobacteriota bacterium]
MIVSRPAGRAPAWLFASFLWVFHPQAQWIDVPFVPQTEHGCGAACVSMIMNYWHRQPGVDVAPPPSEDEVFASLYSEEAKAIHAADLEKYLRERAYRVFAFEGNIGDLDRHLGKGRPLLVGLEEKSAPTGYHYVVVAGLDLNQGWIYVNDPARGKMHRIARSEFEKAWKARRNWTLLALPSGSDQHKPLIR